MKKYNMRSLILLLLTFFSQNAQALDYSEARHLWGRTSYGVRPISSNQRVNERVNVSRKEAIDNLLLSSTLNIENLPGPNFPLNVYQKLADKKRPKAEKQKLRKQVVSRHKTELESWWWQQLLITKKPLQEKMVLFWHKHFTSDLRKANPPEMYQQNQIFRKHALGRYNQLLLQVLKDPAIQLYLDNIKNKKNKPNENLARELLEIFTLGEGHYTEQDIKETARALTGWRANRVKFKLTFKAKQHDNKSKTILGVTGNWGLTDVIDIILEQPRTSEFITEKFWREFISDSPAPTEVTRIALIFRTSGYDIKILLKEILISSAFWDKNNRNNLIKSPVELIVGAVRQFNIPIRNTLTLAKQSAKAGQRLFFPPDVKGWRGGTQWLDAGSFLQRKTILDKFLPAQIPMATNKYAFIPRPYQNASDYLTATLDNPAEQFFAINEKANYTAKNKTNMEKLRYLLTHDNYQFK